MTADSQIPITATPRKLNPKQTWRPLRLFNLYRMIMAGFFCIIAISDTQTSTFGEHLPLLFDIAAGSYLIITIANVFTIASRKPRFQTQVYIQVIIDILIITLLIYSSGGIKTGLGMLLIITVASGSILLAGQAAASFAAAATICMLSQQLLFQVNNPDASSTYTQAGLLGASFFITALLAHALAKRIRESEALAAKRGVDLANMEQLADYVIQRMQTGVIVIDKEKRIWQINNSARQLLGQKKGEKQQHLQNANPALAEQFIAWERDNNHKSPLIRPSSGTNEVLPRFASLGDDNSTLIFLEDATNMTHQAQQLKLASLGRLAGSIAHEIRNPLGAISHAGQLLAESPQLDKNDKRLTEIIRTNTQRMNDIIENVLQIGRRRQAIPETIHLNSWLENFLDEFCASQKIPRNSIQLNITPPELETEFDSSQLHQVLWNLCHNGIRHSHAHTGKPSLQLIAQTTLDSLTPYLDIIDQGEGISAEDMEHIFEPFFTTESKGTGLGLYIAKELCEYNHAYLRYLPNSEGGGCFRLSFSDPRRRRNNING